MKRFKNQLIAAAVLSVLAIIGTIMNSHQAAAQNQDNTVPVRLVAPSPVPVTGSVTSTNTTSAPAITLDISKSASQHIDLTCGNFGFNGGPISFQCISSIFAGTNYVVPAGQNLVVTSVEVTAAPGGSSATLIFGSPSGDIDKWVVPGDGFTHSFTLPSGIVFPPGYAFNASSVIVGLLGAGIQQVFLNGFLTSN